MDTTPRDARNLRSFSYLALTMAAWFAAATILLGGDFIDALLVIVLAWAFGQWRGVRRYSAVEEQ